MWSGLVGTATDEVCPVPAMAMLMATTSPPGQLFSASYRKVALVRAGRCMSVRPAERSTYLSTRRDPRRQCRRSVRPRSPSRLQARADAPPGGQHPSGASTRARNTHRAKPLSLCGERRQEHRRQRPTPVRKVPGSAVHYRVVAANRATASTGPAVGPLRAR